MLNKILLVIWFILRPKYYLHFFSLIKRKFLFNHDTLENSKKAFEWAVSNSLPYVDKSFRGKKLNINGELVGLDNDTIIEGQKLEAKIISKDGRIRPYSFTL